MTDTDTSTQIKNLTRERPTTSPRTRPLLASFIVLAAACYRPILFWTSNAGDLPSLTKSLIVVVVTAVIGGLAGIILVRLGLRPLVAGLAVACIVMILANWEEFPGAAAPLLLSLVLVIAFLVHRRGAPGWIEAVSLSFLAAFGAVPLAQAGVSLAQGSAPYPIVAARPPVTAQPSGRVEDVVVVILDSYPNLQIAESWFGHRPERLVRELENIGFTVETGSWSRHTFTSLSVSSTLELQSVIEPGPTGKWDDRSSLWSILRGDNFVSRTLGSAGFSYTHIESGWAGTTCGPEVDRCIASPWVDEQIWRLLQPSIAGSWVEDRHHFLTGTFNSVKALHGQLEILSNNRSFDYLFAHLLLPHEPVLVDADCNQRVDPIPVSEDAATRRGGLAGQMECIDLLVVEAIDVIDANTAVLLTGDHGPGTTNQVGRPPEEWSDAGIAERFGVFLAHKLPTGCKSPDLPEPMSAMAAILSCAVGEEIAVAPPSYLIGDQDPEYVKPNRMDRIKAAVRAGTLLPDAD